MRSSTAATRSAGTPSAYVPIHAKTPPKRTSAPSSEPSAPRNRTSTPGPLPSGSRSSSGARDRQPRLAPDARRVVDLSARLERRPQPVERRHGVGREDGRAAAAQRPRDRGVGPDHRDAAQRRRVERQRAGGVAGEHEARSGGAAQLARDRLLRPRRGRRRGRLLALERADARGEPQQPQYLLVDRVLADVARPHRGDEGVAPRAARARHQEVEPGARGGDGRAAGEPVGHHDAVVRPLVVQDLAQQRALGHGVTVDAVVGGHDRPRRRRRGRSPRTARGRARAACARRRGRRA